MTTTEVHSVLERASRADIRYDPFVHVVLEDCLPEAYYRDLAASYPTDDTVVAMNKHSGRVLRPNQRNDILAHRALEDPSALAPIWREFIRFHTSTAFYRQLIELLGPELRTIHPNLERRIGHPLGECTTGIRFDPASDLGEISLDCHVGINTPTTTPSQVIGVHVDDPSEIAAMLLYFRHDDDTSVGGDLLLHRWKQVHDRRFRSRNGVDTDAVEAAGSIPYRANTLVLFINSLDALHSVSERGVARQSRRLANIIVEAYRSVPDGLFPVVLHGTPAPPPGFKQRLKRRARTLKDRTKRWLLGNH